MSESASIKVGMRMRPLVGHEKGQKPCISISGQQIDIIHANLSSEDQEQYEGEGPFAFDVVMDSSDKSSPDYVDNNKCYELMGKPLVEQVLLGYNACLFCYGQTGTGKTATMMGYEDLGSGLLPRMLGDMCTKADEMRKQGCKVTLTVQMLEVYNDEINDLLVDRDKWEKVNVKTRVLPSGVIIQGASERQVETLDECIKIMDEGTERKTIAATKMNPHSSRGHTVFKLTIEKSGGADAKKLKAEVYFADLAGHENIKTTAVTGQRLTELKHINGSLMYLQRAISEPARLSSSGGKGRKGNTYSPFRNSELTVLLANGLVGNSKAYVIVTLSPAAAHFDTSYSSIEFGLEVKGVKLEVSANVAVDPVQQVKALQAEVAQLKKALAEAQAGGPRPQPSPKGKAKAKPGKGTPTDKDSNDKDMEKMQAEIAKLKEENEALQKRIKDQDQAPDNAKTEQPHHPYLTKLSTFENKDELKAKEPHKNAGTASAPSKGKKPSKCCGCCAKRAPNDPEKARLSQIESGGAKE